MNFKRYVESSDTWLDSHYIRGTDTDTLTLPAVIFGDGTAATLSIKGNTVQNDIPSQSNPTDVVGVGERTGNSFDMAWYENKTGITVTGNKATGTCERFFNVKLSIPSELYGQTLTWSVYIKRPNNPNTARLQTADNGIYNYGNNIAGEGRSSVSFTATSTIRLYINYANTGSDTIELSDIILNIGSTALPYEPYGVKLPILINDAITNIYIGDNPLRKSLDGTAYDTLDADGTLTQRVDSDGSVLATPVVTQITMPTFTLADGANTVSVDTTVQPSEMTMTYHGWHPVQSVHNRTAQLLNPANIIPDSMFNVNASPSPAIEYSDTFNCSNYIPVTSGTYLRMFNGSAIGNYFFEFDSNKQYLRQKAPGEGQPMSTSSDAAYVIFNINKTYDIDKYMFARTAVPIPYAPYWN